MIEKKFKDDPYRILVVANKFQTGYDEPLLRTMYVDKGLSDIKAVQTLSRLNRCYPDKNDVFVLDFVNDASVIKAAFDKYYKTTVLSGETDANKLNDLVDSMEPMEVYDESEVDYVAELYLSGANREDGLDQKIDICVERYKGLIWMIRLSLRVLQRPLSVHIISYLLSCRMGRWNGKNYLSSLLFW